MPHISTIFDDDVTFAITDKSNYIMIQVSPSLPIKINVGDHIPSHDTAFEAMKTGKVIIKDITKDVYGTAFRAYQCLLEMTVVISADVL